jgi:valine dehydrogenase (NAD+)
VTPPEVHVRRHGGLVMIVAIDSTARGPALGGCRWKLYADEAAARSDALALAAAMTRKAALARLALGGGKAVVLGDPRARSDADLHAFGDFVASLGGRYVTAADMGTGEREMAAIAARTRHVVGLPRALGGCGDPGPFTAEGVQLALAAALAERGLRIEGARVAVQGAGSVGAALARGLVAAGARVLAADPSREALARLPAEVEVVSPEAITRTPCEVFAPCGPPGVIGHALARALPASIVCGAANNPLAERDVARTLAERGVLYVPDYVANAGGLIHLAAALAGGDDAATRRQLEVIPENLARVLALAKADGCDPAQAAEALARAAAGQPVGQSPRASHTDA